MAVVCAFAGIVSVAFALISCSCSCLSNLDCLTNESCCGDVCKPDHYCLGHFCNSSSDCGIHGSCCASSTPPSHRKCRANCASFHCNTKSDCGRLEHCCSNKCSVGNCIGKPCDTNVDCGGDANLQCCFNLCYSWKDCDDGTSVAVMIILIVVVIIGILFKIFVCSQALKRLCQRLVPHRGIASRQPEQIIPPPYPEQDPPPYQIVYQDYPPPQYEQVQTTISPLCQTVSSRVTDAQPLYCAQSSLAICCSNPRYGAVVQ